MGEEIVSNFVEIDFKVYRKENEVKHQIINMFTLRIVSCVRSEIMHTFDSGRQVLYSILVTTLILLLSIFSHIK